MSHPARLLAPLGALLASACSTTVERSFTVDAPPERVWEVLGEGFGEVDSWASGVAASSAKPLDADRAGPTGRTCSTDLGPLDENVLLFDATDRRIAYEAHSEAMPFFVRGLENEWRMTPLADGGTQVDMNFVARLTPGFNVVMWPFMRGKITRLLDESIEELTYFVEQGEPHPRKLEAMAEASR